MLLPECAFSRDGAERQLNERQYSIVSTFIVTLDVMTLKVHRSTTLSGGVVADFNEPKPIGHAFRIIHVKKGDSSTTT
jgi:hypothetical protein